MHNCPSCNKSKKLSSSNVLSYICDNCGNLIEVNSNKITKIDATPKIYPLSKVNLGLTGNLRGSQYKIIGFLNYIGIEENWQTEEWVLLGSDNKIYYLEYEFEENQFYFYEPINLGLIDISKLHIYETYSTRVIKAAGEFDFVLDLNQKITCKDGHINGVKYTIESDSINTEHYKKISFSKAEIFKGFNIASEDAKNVPLHFGEAKHKSKSSFWLSSIAYIVGGLLLCICNIPFFDDCVTTNTDSSVVTTLTPTISSSSITENLTSNSTDVTCTSSNRSIMGRTFGSGGGGSSGGGGGK